MRRANYIFNKNMPNFNLADFAASIFAENIYDSF